MAARVIPGRTSTALPWFLSGVTTSLIRWVIQEAERQVQLALNHPDAGAVLRKATDKPPTKSYCTASGGAWRLSDWLLRVR